MKKQLICCFNFNFFIMKKYLAELVGTFVLTLFGCGTAVSLNCGVDMASVVGTQRCGTQATTLTLSNLFSRQRNRQRNSCNGSSSSGINQRKGETLKGR